MVRRVLLFLHNEGLQRRYRTPYAVPGPHVLFQEPLCRSWNPSCGTSAIWR